MHRGPEPEYRPEFSGKELAEARKVLRQRNSPNAVARRARLVLMLAEDPTVRSPEAAQTLAVHENTVRRWRKEWALEGFRLEDLPRSGRPIFFSRTSDHDH